MAYLLSADTEFFLKKDSLTLAGIDFAEADRTGDFPIRINIGVKNGTFY